MVLHVQYEDETMVSVEIPKSEEELLLALDDLIDRYNSLEFFVEYLCLYLATIHKSELTFSF